MEVDGDIHDLQQEEDARREKALRELGLRTCADGSPFAHRVEALPFQGFRNDEVVRDASRSAVVGKVKDLLS